MAKISDAFSQTWQAQLQGAIGRGTDVYSVAKSNNYGSTAAGLAGGELAGYASKALCADMGLSSMLYCTSAGPYGVAAAPFVGATTYAGCQYGMSQAGQYAAQTTYDYVQPVATKVYENMTSSMANYVSNAEKNLIWYSYHGF